mgnify:CR=1 FL=1|jgi:site-specific recombinase XerC
MPVAKPLSTRHKATYRESDVARRIMSRIHVRPHSKRSSTFKLKAVRAILVAYAYKSVWNEATEDLTITRIDRTKPLSLVNAMVVQVREANRKLPIDVRDKALEIVAGIVDDD